jgi:peptidoglycan-N-acetylglucosamine deacetylase
VEAWTFFSRCRRPSYQMKLPNPIAWRFARSNAKILVVMNATLLTAGGVCGASGAFAWAAVAPSAQLFGSTIRRTGNASTIALTFDDGPNPAVTPALLDLLDRHHAKATFFLVGTWVREAPVLAKEIAARGHVLGNHTDTHPALVFRSPRRIAAELNRCDDAMESATGRKPRWMRPPFGFRSPLLDGIVRERGSAGVVMWSAWAYDWKPQPAEPVIERLRDVRGGDIVLLHDGDYRLMNGDRRHTVAALEYWLPRWKVSGIRFVTLDEIHQQD